MDREAGWVILFLVIIGLMWFVAKGHLIGSGGPFLEPNYRFSDIKKSFRSQEYRSFQEERSAPEEFASYEKLQAQPLEVSSTDSSYKGKINLRIAGARREDPAKEYIELSVANGDDIKNIPITGWILENSRGEEISIGKGAYLVYSARVNRQNNIVLKNGERAYLITGRSPIGTSFRLNICTGYFEQFQDFEPFIRKECPHPKYENQINEANLSDNCLDYIEKLPRCEMPLKEKPISLDNDCLNYINANINYNACVDAHKFDDDFYSDTWMVYFNRDQEIWKQKRETITLYDNNGKMVAQINY